MSERQGLELLPQPSAQPVTRAPNFKECYSNTLRFRLSPIECILTFGSQPDIGAGSAAIQDEVSVIMTLSFLKTLSINFGKSVAAIEGELGEPIKVTQKGLITDEQLQMLVKGLRDNPLIVP